MPEPITRKVETVVEVAHAFARRGKVVVAIKQTEQLTVGESKQLRKQLKAAENVATVSPNRNDEPSRDPSLGPF